MLGDKKVQKIGSGSKSLKSITSSHQLTSQESGMESMKSNAPKDRFKAPKAITKPSQFGQPFDPNASNPNILKPKQLPNIFENISDRLLRQSNISRPSSNATSNTSNATSNTSNATSNTSNVSTSRQLLNQEMAVAGSSSKMSKAHSMKSERMPTREGFSLTSSPTTNLPASPHTTIPGYGAYDSVYAKVFSPDGKEITEYDQQKIDSKRKMAQLRKTTTLLQELEDMQGQPAKPSEQNEFDLGLVPIDIYTTNENETADQIVEARGYVLQERLGSGENNG